MAEGSEKHGPCNSWKIKIKGNGSERLARTYHVLKRRFGSLNVSVRFKTERVSHIPGPWGKKKNTGTKSKKLVRTATFHIQILSVVTRRDCCPRLALEVKDGLFGILSSFHSSRDAFPFRIVSCDGVVVAIKVLHDTAHRRSLAALFAVRCHREAHGDAGTPWSEAYVAGWW